MKKITETIKEFYYEVGLFMWGCQQWGVKTALDNSLISFTKWFLGAKRIQITYFPDKK